MKALKEINSKEIINIILNSDSLNSKFESYINETELMYIDEKINCFQSSAIDYSISVYNKNYFKIMDNDLFLYGIEKSIKNYGCSDKLEKLFNQTKKLQDTNLFSFYCKKLAFLYYTEEIESIIEDLESLGMNFYNKEYTPDLENYLDCFIDNGYLDNIYLNSDNKPVKMQYL